MGGPRRIPVLDLAAAPAAGARAVAAAGGDLGFFYVTGHGVDRRVVARVYDRAAAFFALPAAAKARSAMGTVSEFSGWNALGSQRLADTLDGDGGRPAAPYAHDLKESVGIGPPPPPPGDPVLANPEARRFFAPMPWPEILGFRPAFETAWRALDGLAQRLMRVFALGLDLPAGRFDGAIDRSISHLYVHSYPPVRPPEAGAVRAGAHTDFGSLTVLDTGANPEGLEVRTPEGEWLPVVPPPGAFVVNLGDAMQQWTNDRWRSSLHRVIAPSAGAAARPRMTLTFFHQPNWDAVIEPLPTCIGVDRPARYTAVTSAAHYAAKVARLEGRA